MTVSLHVDQPSPDRAAELGRALDEAVSAARAVHEAAQALTAAVQACAGLPGEVYRYAGDTSTASAALTQASRRLSACAREAAGAREAGGGAGAGAGGDAGNEAGSVRDLRQAAAEALQTAAGVHSIAAALRDAAVWYSGNR